MFLSAARIVLAVAVLTLGVSASEISIRLEGSTFRVAGWEAGNPPPDGWQSIFAVYAGESGVPPVLGSYAVVDGSLTFRPRFPMNPGVRMRAVFQQPSGTAVEAFFEPAKTNSVPSTRVEHVYPSTSVVPENQLKFYLHFSAPMSRGEAWQRIQLLNQDGKPVDLPFLEIDQELWDREYKRLTVLFDPGRIKRGVLPLEETGPAIEQGKHYTLVIDQEWRDAQGLPLQQEYRKQFRVVPAEREALEPNEWRLHAPKAGSSNPVVLDLPRPLDAALLERLVEVEGVDGTVQLAKGETQWRFTPTDPWKPGDYRIVIDTALEDLAGNKIGKPFDVDVFERITERLRSKTVSLPFRIRQQ